MCAGAMAALDSGEDAVTLREEAIALYRKKAYAAALVKLYQAKAHEANDAQLSSRLGQVPSQIAEPAAVEPTVVEDPPAVAEESESSPIADDPDALYESQPAVFIPPEIKERASSVETTYVTAAASVATVVEDPPLEQSYSFSGALSCGVFDVDTSCVGCTFGDDGAGVPR